ncbi:MAG: hypothetical protein UY48_C0007G0019 [Candidatus Gottesmanbacteria bacterium GW2011_GWB1_49_7]|uniref:PqqD family protein n=1 Tax=Candidatus Gottesmanbacteria bacterium GW2011_GWB1_49_7 TaxID=1618448 RepID=A0A0G1W2W7_9BACT|nr:MAG: hypothetical protein UY48_C0007G0019 [Candidatus Gottesmanbacteria bacterium GW2011_GWB1_49_7]
MKPKRMWEWREYKLGSLIENGIALNETGTFIWKLCDGKTSVDLIINAMCRTYDVQKSCAKQDVTELIQLLIDEHSLKSTT